MSAGAPPDIAPSTGQADGAHQGAGDPVADLPLLVHSLACALPTASPAAAISIRSPPIFTAATAQIKAYQATFATAFNNSQDHC